jgi:hypothetical protein
MDNNMAGAIISNIITEDNIAIQQSPLDNAIFVEIQQSAHESNSPDLDHILLSNIGTLG